MSESIYEKAIKEVLQELIGDPGEKEPFAENLVNKYLQDLVGKEMLLRQSGIKDEDYSQEFRGLVMDRVVDALLKSYGFKDSLYKNSYERLKAFYQEYKSYGDLFTEIYPGQTYLNEIFVRLVEEEEKVAITSAKQLQELTGITEIYGYHDEKTGKTIPYGDKEPTKAEAEEEAYRQIEDTFIKAMSYRYSKALEDILEAGGKYSDLLQVKPSFFSLPESWEGTLAKDQYSSIQWAIEDTFLLGEPGGLMMLPNLRSIAEDIEAPYSVLMDVYNRYSHFIKNYRK
jgi:hypothetical protein